MELGKVGVNGKTSLGFVEQGVKIYKDVYWIDVLHGVVCRSTLQLFNDAEWTFQQDSAPPHDAKSIEEWYEDHYSGFITSPELQPYYLGLKPMDYSVSSILEAGASAKAQKLS